MKTCPHCGCENPDSQVLCIQCDSPLALEPDPPQIPPSDEEKAGTTQLLEQAHQGTSTPRWGTARLGAERKLLFHVHGHDAPLVIGLRDRLVIGRFDSDTDTSPDVSLDDYAAAELGVSRRHAVITVEEDGLKVMDLNSANATYINGQKLIAHQARILRDGDELCLGKLILRVTFA